MATKIRLARHGHKDYAYYHIVVADSRSPRDGKYIERIGSYNPNNNPAKVDLKFDRALYWVNVGAQPTDTVRNILSNEGVLLMKHLMGGVKKGAFTEEVAKQKFEAWKAGKDKANDQVVAKLAASKEASAKERLEAEKAANKAKAAQIAAKKAELLAAQEEAAAEETLEEPVAEEADEEDGEEEEEEAEEAAPAEETAAAPVVAAPPKAKADRIVIAETDANGNVIYSAYKKSFTARVIQSPDDVQERYEVLKNALLSYKKVNSRVSWSYDSFKTGKKQLAKFAIRGKSLCLFLALDPSTLEESKYNVADAGDSKKYEAVPCRLRLSSKRSIKWGLELIEKLAEQEGLVLNPKYKPQSFRMENETTETLLEKGLIKKIV